MEPKEKEEFIKLRMTMAADKVKAAKDLLRTGHRRDVVSASYYAMFCATKAVLLAEGKGILILMTGQRDCWASTV
ncbi:HEPN domain-containing protein [bacterium]|nr:HEPN domain-containing protein [bacterium]